jgi:hypothetical protein
MVPMDRHEKPSIGLASAKRRFATSCRFHDLKPHLVKHFLASDDPAFGQKLEDIAPLYLKPSDNAGRSRSYRRALASQSARLVTTRGMG